VDKKGLQRRLSLSRHPARYAIALSLVMTAIVAVNVVGPLFATDSSSYIYGSQGRAWIDLHMKPVGLDLKSEALNSTWFQLNMMAVDGKPFILFIIYPTNVLPERIGYPKNASLGSSDPVRIIDPWELDIPWTWQLRQTGEFPWDEYSLTFVFAFNRTVDVSWVTSGISAPPGTGIADQWTITQRFERLNDAPQFQERLLTMGFTQDDIAGYQAGNGGRLPLELNGYHDFYALTISFVRLSPDIWRGLGAFWAPAIALAGFLVIAWGRRDSLETRDGIAIFLGMALAAMPFVIGGLQFLPPRPTAVEGLLYLEVVIAIAFAGWIVAKVKPPTMDADHPSSRPRCTFE
jgi:hypothetical protein